MRRRTILRRIAWTLLILFLILNGVAIMHAYRFTHFSKDKSAKTPEHLSFGQKLMLALTGIDNPRPENKKSPTVAYERIRRHGISEAWMIRTPAARGTVILFHGYGGEKSGMLDKAAVFQSLGFNTLLVDFHGAGGSAGVQCTIGYKEADEVMDWAQWVATRGESNLILFGTSMGAAALMRAVGELGLKPKAAIIECPFGTMYKTVCNRFRTQGAPVFPMAGLLVFWGGVENGFWAFGHNPEEYARHMQCPTLLLCGGRDEKVTRAETDAIYSNLPGPKTLHIYPEARHENYLRLYREAWTADIASFLHQP
ncbi:MAG: hypothetical protein JWP27_150 [Flaviaesturariibacter sp.]|nr:hypothetical protein [Flaviaesturariibacter sp.]